MNLPATLQCDMARERKITLGECGSPALPTRLLVYCRDYRCSHSITIDASQWSDDVRLSDLEPKISCQARGYRGSDGVCRTNAQGAFSRFHLMCGGWLLLPSVQGSKLTTPLNSLFGSQWRQKRSPSVCNQSPLSEGAGEGAGKALSASCKHRIAFFKSAGLGLLLAGAQLTAALAAAGYRKTSMPIRTNLFISQPPNDPL